jgi:hypothetical protein
MQFLCQISVFVKSNCYQAFPASLHIYIFWEKYPIGYVKINISAKNARKQIVIGL